MEVREVSPVTGAELVSRALAKDITIALVIPGCPPSFSIAPGKNCK